MLWKVIRHEWKLILADRTLAIVGGLFLALFAYALWNGNTWVRYQEGTLQSVLAAEKKQHRDLQQQFEAIARGQNAGPAWTDPRIPSVMGTRGARYAILPPAPLGALSIGQSDLYPYYIQVTRTAWNNLLANEEIENPLNQLAGRFDLAFVIVYLFPLLILALSYNLISAEREQGTLALILAQPVSLRTVALGKVLLRAAVMLGLAVGLSVAGTLLTGVDLTAAGVAPRLLLWIGVVTLYGAFWFGLAALVNAWRHSSATNVTILAGVWLLLVVIVPSLLNVAVNAIHPLPSRVEMIQASREAYDDAMRRGSQLLARYYEDHPELAPKDQAAAVADLQIRTLAVRAEIDRLTQPVVEEFDRRLATQQAFVNRCQFLSPAIVVHQSLNDLAGTGFNRYQHFLGLAAGFHRKWAEYFTPRILAKEQMTPAHVAQLPAYQFREEPLGDLASRTFVGCVGLAVPAILLGFAVAVVFRRYVLAA